MQKDDLHAIIILIACYNHINLPKGLIYDKYEDALSEMITKIKQCKKSGFK